MKKKFKRKNVLALLAVLMAAYCVFAFGNLSFNPIDWNGFSRVTFLLIMFGSVLYTE